MKQNYYASQQKPARSYVEAVNSELHIFSSSKGSADKGFTLVIRKEDNVANKVTNVISVTLRIPRTPTTKVKK